METNKCAFSYNGRKCYAEASIEKPFKFNGKEFTRFSIARCKTLCPIHYKAVVLDNIRRFNKGIEIPEALEFTKELYYNTLWSFFGLKEKRGKNGN